MLHWIVDNAVLLYVLIAFFAFGFGLLYRNTRDRRALYALTGTVAFGLLVWLLSILIVTDQQQIRRNLHAMADAVTNRKTEQLTKYLAPEVFFNRDRSKLDRATIVAVSKQQADRLNIQGIRLTQFHFEKLSREEKKAIVLFSAVVEMGEILNPCRCKTEFVYQGDTWLLHAVEIFTPVGNQPIQIPVR